MFGLQDLKPRIVITPTSVECPVKGCFQIVERQQRYFRRDERFRCPDHEIYISPSTFEYSCEEDNLLWKNQADIDLLRMIKGTKRESRISRDNSEDALTWNVFRFLENINGLAGLLSHLTTIEINNPQLIYWSYCQETKSPWKELNRARQEFGEHLQRSSEPDLIAVTDKALFFIEAKLTASNNTYPSDPNNRKGYLAGGNEWHSQVFKSNFEAVAIQAKKYELFRFWLLGTWLAKETNRDFYLFNIVPAERERDIESRFIPHIKVDRHKCFKRISWEKIYDYIAPTVHDCPEKQMLTDYFQNKTVGYNRLCDVQKAFMISPGILTEGHTTSIPS